MENVVITREDIQEIILSVQITFIINCSMVIFIFILGNNVDILTHFFASQSIGLTIVTIIQTAKVLYPPFKNEPYKLYFFLPAAIIPASLIGINFIHAFISLPELMVLVTIVTIPVTVLFHYKDNKIKSKKALSHEINKNSENDKALQANKLLLLQAQINPHFLFNTLENIKNYIKSDPTKAEQLLKDYTFFLRKSLPTTQSSDGTVAGELALIDAYIAIQQTRFPYIRFIGNVNDKLKNYPLPPLLIQPLIENAIAHGLAPQGHQGLITLTIEKDLNKLIIKVIDTGIGFEEVPPNTDSVALKNIEQRLHLYHPLSSLTILNPEQGAIVELAIPIND